MYLRNYSTKGRYIYLIAFTHGNTCKLNWALYPDRIKTLTTFISCQKVNLISVVRTIENWYHYMYIDFSIWLLFVIRHFKCNIVLSVCHIRSKKILLLKKYKQNFVDVFVRKTSYVTWRWGGRCLITVRKFERKIQFLNEKLILNFKFGHRVCFSSLF